MCFDLSINADTFVGETSWTITNSGGSVVASGAPSFANATNTETLCLPAGSYTLNVADSFGDGIGGTGSDDVNLTTGSGDQLIVAGDVAGSGSSFDFTLDASPFNFPAGATVEQSFTIFGGTGTCSLLGTSPPHAPQFHSTRSLTQ